MAETVKHTPETCPLRITVSDVRTDGCRGGFACSWTGGHCIPSEWCNLRREQASRLKTMDEAYSALLPDLGAA